MKNMRVKTYGAFEKRIFCDGFHWIVEVKFFHPYQVKRWMFEDYEKANALFEV